MANAKKCDICGKFYDHYQNITLKSGMTMNGCMIRFAADNGVCWTSSDLCPECMTKVHTLLCDICDERGERD